MRVWNISRGKLSSYLGCSAAFASPDCVDSPNPNGPHGGMPGWSLTLSASGRHRWDSLGNDALRRCKYGVVNGRLMAFDAVNLSKFSDGSGRLVPLWDSQDWNFKHPKLNRLLWRLGSYSCRLTNRDCGPLIWHKHLNLDFTVIQNETSSQ